LPKHLLSSNIEYEILASNEDLYLTKIYNCVDTLRNVALFENYIIKKDSTLSIINS